MIDDGLLKLVICLSLVFELGVSGPHVFDLHFDIVGGEVLFVGLGGDPCTNEQRLEILEIWVVATNYINQSW